MSCEIRQTSPSLLEAVSLSLPVRRYAELAADYWRVDDTTFCYQGSFYPDGEDRGVYEPFSFLVMTRIAGAQGIADISDDGMRIRLAAAEPSVTLLTTVVTGAPDLEAVALERLNREAAGRAAEGAPSCTGRASGNAPPSRSPIRCWRICGISICMRSPAAAKAGEWPSRPAV
ncbi:hypothetical protein [Paenibacillus thiaminolyticus]|uniref:hypothetical protein n=1 Tax=Paenibacillus thiaminolyticus TaxID=49283 RepID=UPI003C130270